MASAAHDDKSITNPRRVRITYRVPRRLIASIVKGAPLMLLLPSNFNVVIIPILAKAVDRPMLSQLSSAEMGSHPNRETFPQMVPYKSTYWERRELVGAAVMAWRRVAAARDPILYEGYVRRASCFQGQLDRISRRGESRNK